MRDTTGKINGTASINFLYIIDPIKERYIFFGVPVSVVKGVLKQSRASHSKNSLIPINFSY